MGGPATSEVAEGRAITTGSSVLERARLVVDSAGGTTHTLTSYYPLEDVEGTTLADPTPGPAGGLGGGLRVLTDRGLEPESITERLHARMPSVDELDELALPSGEPVVILTRVIWANGRPVEFARGVQRALRFAWEYHFEIQDTRGEAR
jgi:GntR family transcriptional regulator